MEVQLVNSNRQLLDHHHHHHEWEFLRPFFKRLLRHFLATFLLTIQVPPMAITSIVFLFSYLHPPPPPPPPPSHATLVRKFSSLFYFFPNINEANPNCNEKTCMSSDQRRDTGIFFLSFFYYITFSFDHHPSPIFVRVARRDTVIRPWSSVFFGTCHTYIEPCTQTANEQANGRTYIRIYACIGTLAHLAQTHIAHSK